MRMRFPGAIVLIAALAVGVSLAATPTIELRVNTATFVAGSRPTESAPQPNRFGPGEDGSPLLGAPFLHQELRFSCAQVPEGDYYVGVAVIPQPWINYLGYAEFLGSWLHLYHNDTRLPWTSHTEPIKPEGAAEKNLYQAEMRRDRLVHIRPGDILRVLYTPDGGDITIGSLRLYATHPTGRTIKLYPPEPEHLDSVWLAARFDEPRRDGDTVHQPCTIVNPGVLPRTVTLDVIATDYLMRNLVSQHKTVTLSPGEKMDLNFDVKPGDSGRARLTVVATSPGVRPPVRLCKYYVDDLKQGPRPTTSLCGEWEMTWLPGPEPGAAPPADAKWAKVNVPHLQTIEKNHCLWYRKTFTPPGYVKGERVMLKCGLLLSEGWFYLNGKQVGHILHGSLPFEVDLTSAFKPGQPNELLVAVRDWIAYSPKNRDRVSRGEEPIFKDAMIDCAGYPSLTMGIGGQISLEPRPAVSVEEAYPITSVRKHLLTLRYRLISTTASDQAVTLKPTILDAGQVAKALPEQKITVPAGKTATVVVEQPWPGVKLWSVEDPHLYVLQTDLTPSSGVADRHIQRFGFREIWIDGVYFVINGVRAKIRSQWAGRGAGIWQSFESWEPEKRYEMLWLTQTNSVRDDAYQMTRTHNMDGVEEGCDLCDETGMMLKVEEADMAQQNFTFDQAYWNGAVAHEAAMVATYGHHACVMMWSAGNENNLWNWAYQGEAATALGHRWQMKIDKAMRDADPMARPIEWESDGDLAGEGEYHAFHYAREMSQFPDVPNGAFWGPLDGKTVVPYHSYPVILGQKPLTTGESMIPDDYNRPNGFSVLDGDDAYLGGQDWGHGWMEGARFFVNGFRDVEFALIDTYTPLWMIKPQTIVLKQEVRSFVGGQTIKRDANVHNDISRWADLTLRWRLETGVKPTPPLPHGEVKLAMAPAELRRLSLSLALPAVKQETPVTFRLDLLEGAKVVHTETQDWTINPPLAIKVKPGFGIAIYDPQGSTVAMLKKLKVPVTVLTELKAPEGRALILGRDALKPAPQGPWREDLTAFVRGGGKVLILEQSETPDFLPTPLTQAVGHRETIAYVRCADHPVTKGLTDADLRWWGTDAAHPADEHYVSAANFRKPINGNFLPVLDAGTNDGIVETPLLEEYEGKGGFLLCQMLLTEKAAVAPQACALVQNVLDYLAEPTCYRSLGATAVFAPADSTLRKALDDARLVYEDLTDKPGDLSADRFKVAIVDCATALNDATASALRNFAAAGGHVMLHRPAPDRQAALEALLGVRLRFFPVAQEPIDIRYHCFRLDNVGLMAGISNHEFFWADTAVLTGIRHNGGWWMGYESQPEVYLADYWCSAGDDQADRVTRLTRPDAMLQVPAGKGYFLINQIRIDKPVPDVAATASRLRALMLTNLGCTLRSAGATLTARRQRLNQYDYFTVDLSPYANRGVRDDKATGLVGWTNQGENDMRNLPTGRPVFDGIPFQIGSPKAAVVLYSVSANNLDLPKEVKGIKVGRRADVLFFLHTMAWNADEPFRYRVNYDDGTSVEIRIFNGQQVTDWWSDPVRLADAMARHGMFVAWQGDNPMHKGALLPGWEWVNPNPDKVIRDIDFLTLPETGYGPVPVLVAITGAVGRPPVGVVTDVIGTQGVRVKLGTQVQDIYYIGVVGLDPKHPFYGKAVAAHRAMAVGQTVTVQDDAVTQDADGHRIAYVYLGRDLSLIGECLNTKVIGNGLGRLGNFEGNNMHRVYLENLGLIARQNKTGMWAFEPQQ